MLKTPFARDACSEVLVHEVRCLAGELESLPLARLDVRAAACGRTARELAEGSVARLRRIDAIAFGYETGHVPVGPRPLGEILMDLDVAYLSATASLGAMGPARWDEVIPCPFGLSPWSLARRGELLWLALHDLARHNRHLSSHVRAGCGIGRSPGDDAGGALVTLEPLEPMTAGA